MSDNGATRSAGGGGVVGGGGGGAAHLLPLYGLGTLEEGYEQVTGTQWGKTHSHYQGIQSENPWVDR